ncbi:sigma 54-interacting transcriptional regulator [Pendulispora rubella]|uniref:Sigma 54-interacting transcriptional regulator n=1 Tax=Pendulispora rubella TaxID=2741070 RepID=A0ABZ2LHB9_9BACT
MEDKPTLTISEGPSSGSWVLEVCDSAGVQYLPLAPGRFVVGSSPQAEIKVCDPAVSARHCSIVVSRDGISLCDLGSKNGTFVGGARVKDAWCAVGTSITIGRSTLTLSEGAREVVLSDGGTFQPLPGVAGSSLPMRRMTEFVRRIAAYPNAVLISGETGTGKELIARALHTEGPRKERPFIALNVSTLPRELVESELFGHERGAFTSATSRRTGAFADAEGGTLFLDEIGELPVEAQPKLLRALDGYEVRRVGATGSGYRPNVRVVAASHVSLDERIDQGLFRRDLYHRLEGFIVDIPALRDRKGDIAVIARTLLASSCAGIGARTLAPGAVDRLSSHDWPGNVRELRNVLLRSADLACDNAGVIEAVHVERALNPRADSRPPLSLTPQTAKALLEKHDNNMSAAAREAGYPRTSFRKVLMGILLERRKR